MTRTRTLIFSSAVMAGLLLCCETTPEVQHVGKPTARLVGLRFEDVKVDYAKLLFDVQVHNPYPASLPLVNLQYSLTSGGSTFMSATALPQTAVPPNARQVITLPDKVVYARVLKALHAQPGFNIPYKAVLRLWVNTPNSGPIKLPLETTGQLALPTPPGIKVGDKIYTDLDVIYVPTPLDIVDKMLETAEVKKSDLVYDLGCGDGRIVVAAARKYGCRAIGYDIDPERVKEALQNVQQNQVGHLVTIEQKDIFTLDLSEADVITLYLRPSLNVRLIPQLEKLKPGARIVSHNWDMEGIKPDKVITLNSKEDPWKHMIYLWVSPLKKEAEER